MAASALARFNTTTFVAASSFAIALGLLAAPPQGGDAAVARVEVALIQLHASIASDTSALFSTVGLAAAEAPSAADATPALNGTTATPPAAEDTGVNVIQNLALGALALAATPLWYLAFPVTLPLSIVGGIAYTAIGSVFITAAGGQVDPISLGLFGAAIGLGFFAAGPIAFAFSAFSSALTPTSSAAATAPAPGAAETETETETAVTGSRQASEPNAPRAASSVVAVGKLSTEAAQADIRSAKPSSASAATATAITQSEPDYPNAPTTGPITDTASDDVETENVPTSQVSRGGSDRASDRSGASRERTRR